MIHPITQSVMAYEGEALDLIFDFCAAPIYTKVIWISEKYVYTPGSETHDGVQALTIEVKISVLVSFEILTRQQISS